jgi:hypothetical protein
MLPQNCCQIYKWNKSIWIEHETLKNDYFNYRYVFFTSNYIVSVSDNFYDVWSLGTYEHHHQSNTKLTLCLRVSGLNSDEALKRLESVHGGLC